MYTDKYGITNRRFITTPCTYSVSRGIPFQKDSVISVTFLNVEIAKWELTFCFYSFPSLLSSIILSRWFSSLSQAKPVEKKSLVNWLCSTWNCWQCNCGGNISLTTMYGHAWPSGFGVSVFTNTFGWTKCLRLWMGRETPICTHACARASIAVAGDTARAAECMPN